MKYIIKRIVLWLLPYTGGIPLVFQAADWETAKGTWLWALYEYKGQTISVDFEKRKIELTK